jgi:hypothetical protein
MTLFNGLDVVSIMAAPSLAGLVAFSHLQVSQIRGRQPYLIVRNILYVIEEIGQQIDHIDGLELAGNPDRQAFVGELVDTLSMRYFRPSWVRSSTKS